MEGQGLAASAASQAGRPDEPALGAVVAADFDDPGVSHVTSDIPENSESQRRSGDDTVVIPPPPAEPQIPATAQTPATPQIPATSQTPPAPQVPVAEQPQQPEPESEQKAAPPELSTPAPEPAPAAPTPRTPAAPAAPPSAAPPSAAAAPSTSLERHTRVDARLLEAALLNLRNRIAAVPLVFELEGSAEVKEERTKLLSHIDDYLLPRVRQSAAPILVALVGSTGAGKSTLVNSIVGAHVSATGVRRPTTNSPVLACHPDDVDWFAENNFLPTLPRVRQEGLARPGRDGLLVLAASEGMPRGIALLDTPDIDSVVQAHHEFAYRFLDASDLWLFMTSASRYADGPVWEILQHARDRKASLGVVLSRIPQTYQAELAEHFSAMLDANGIAAENRFVILETPLVDGLLPDDAYQPVRDWLTDTAIRSDRRVAVLSQTMSGVLDTFKARIPVIAAHVEAQVVLASELRGTAEAAYERAFAELTAGLRDGSLLTGEVEARWQDCATGGDLKPRRGGKPAKNTARKGKRARRGPTHNAALGTALRAAIESFIVSVADRAAEQTDGGWRAEPAGNVLLEDAAADRARGEYAKRVFESAFGPGSASAPPGTGPLPVTGPAEAGQTPFSRSSADLSLRTARAVSAWQDHLTRLVLATGAQPESRRAAFDDESLSLVVPLAMLGEDAPGGSTPPADEESTSVLTEPRRLLASVFGAGALGEILASARADLSHRVRLLLDEEVVRFVEVIESAGPCDDVAAIRLYQAEYSLEAVR
jgi:energy-coupling factor transporter ATP-binding protein EcfA2